MHFAEFKGFVRRLKQQLKGFADDSAVTKLEGEWVRQAPTIPPFDEDWGVRSSLRYDDQEGFAAALSQRENEMAIEALREESNRANTLRETPRIRVWTDYPLHVAVENCQINEVQRLLHEGEDPNETAQCYGTPLHFAARCCGKDPLKTEAYLVIAGLLLRAGADVHSHQCWGGTALHLAAARGNIRLSKLLLKFGADANSQMDQEGRTPLHRAVALGDPKTVAFLLSRGVQINVVAGENPMRESPILYEHLGMTPLHVAARHGYLTIAEQLLSSGSSKHATVTQNAYSRERGWPSGTPFDVAFASQREAALTGRVIRSLDAMHRLEQTATEELHSNPDWNTLLKLLDPLH
jgi:ankyrin repeat protein